jgi:Photosynthesis affected mutant 68
MASKSKHPSDQKDGNTSKPSKGFTTEKSESARLPFEPAQTIKKTAKKTPPAIPKPAIAKPKSAIEKPNAAKKASTGSAFVGIPESVSRRMAKRAGLFCGIPTLLGMLTFVVSYFIVSKNIYKLPPIAVLLVSLGFFGLGVLGLSYGAFSASWDEGRLGSWLGFSEFRTNFGRTISSWKAAQQKNL